MRLHDALSFLRSHGILGPVSSCVGHVVLAIVTILFRFFETKNFSRDVKCRKRPRNVAPTELEMGKYGRIMHSRRVQGP